MRFSSSRVTVGSVAGSSLGEQSATVMVGYPAASVTLMYMTPSVVESNRGISELGGIWYAFAPSMPAT